MHATKDGFRTLVRNYLFANLLSTVSKQPFRKQRDGHINYPRRTCTPSRTQKMDSRGGLFRKRRCESRKHRQVSWALFTTVLGIISGPHAWSMYKVCHWRCLVHITQQIKQETISDLDEDGSLRDFEHASSTGSLLASLDESDNPFTN